MDKLVELMMKLIKSEACGTPLDVALPISLSDEESQRHYLTFNVANVITARSIAIIQKRITILDSGITLIGF